MGIAIRIVIGGRITTGIIICIRIKMGITVTVGL
jgi:hypothetical protein